jgi:hypothetical protein
MRRMRRFVVVSCRRATGRVVGGGSFDFRQWPLLQLLLLLLQCMFGIYFFPASTARPF